MAISFDLSRLTSRTIRSGIGQRVIRGMNTTSSTSGGGLQGVINFVLNGLGSLGSFLFAKVSGFFQFSWTKFWSWFVSTKTFLWNFNWQATDAQLEASIRSQWQALAAQIGGSLGNAFGYIVCGILPGAVIFAFNEPLGAFVLKNVGEEFLEEFVENLGMLFNSALRLGTQIVITETYKNVRKLIKSNSSLVKKLLGEKASKAVQAWGNEGSKPWSFALANEEFLDTTFGSEGAWREAAEEFQEEFDESCVEAGYVVANSVDTFLAADMFARQAAPPLGNVRYVEVTPNRERPDERIVLGGNDQLLRPMIVQTLATYNQLGDRDVGVIYGTPAADLPERSHRPEVVLKFYQKQNKNPDKGELTEAIEMRISFRLMNKTSEDFATDAYAKVLAQAIYREFATPAFKINKGRAIYTYSDFERGYQFVLAVKDDIEAKRIIKKVLDIQSHPFKDEGFRRGSAPLTLNTQTVGERVTIMGQSERLPTRGKVGIVTFTNAYLNTGLQLPPINLVDLTGRKRNVVYKPAS